MALEPVRRGFVAAVSLGCAKNRIDTEEILGLLAGKGYMITDDLSRADAVIVNTCAFIDDARQESIDTILRVIRLHRNGTRPLVVAAGCLAERYGRSLLSSIPELDGAIGVHSYRHTPGLLALCRDGKRPALLKLPAENRRAVAPRLLTTPPHSVYVRIAEGCDNCCRYCLIPSLRGPYRSRPAQEIIEEVQGLLEMGAREVNLIAQDTTAYGIDREGAPALANLIRQIIRLPGKYRIRILYTHPSHITGELIELMASEKRICRYLDLPLQHINNTVLRSMGRPYHRDNIENLIDELRRRIPGIALRTTFLVGYPGETREYFEELLEFSRTHLLERVGVFAFSPQEGTAAASLPGMIRRRVREKRRRELLLAQQQIALELNRKLSGKRIEVLVDRIPDRAGGYYFGRTEQQAPGVDGGVYFRSTHRFLPGSAVSVKVAAESPYSLLGVDPLPLQEQSR